MSILKITRFGTCIDLWIVNERRRDTKANTIKTSGNSINRLKVIGHKYKKNSKEHEWRFLPTLDSYILDAFFCVICFMVSRCFLSVTPRHLQLSWKKEKRQRKRNFFFTTLILIYTRVENIQICVFHRKKGNLSKKLTLQKADKHYKISTHQKASKHSITFTQMDKIWRFH